MLNNRSAKVWNVISDGKFCLPIVCDDVYLFIDTADKTKALLEKNSFFGLEVSQVTLLCQGKVPALLSNDAKLALLPGTKYIVDSKPHGLE